MKELAYLNSIKAEQEEQKREIEQRQFETVKILESQELEKQSKIREAKEKVCKTTSYSPG